MMPHTQTRQYQERGLDTKGADPWADYECRASPPDVIACGDPRDLAASYVYLLGIYLGDGCLSKAPRDVWRLRLFQDQRYVLLIRQWAEAIRAVTQREPGTIARQGCVEIYSNWKHWSCLFPQHGLGRKHLRRLEFREWQMNLVRRYPRELVRGLIQSDGCRSINRVRRPARDGYKEYAYVRYFFTNASLEIRAMFVLGCGLIGVDCRVMTERVISVARRESVEILESFIGPKH